VHLDDYMDFEPLNGIYGLTKENYTFCHIHSVAYFKD